MDRNAFCDSSDVIRFTDWLAHRHHALSIRLDIKSSRFVPGGIRAEHTGLDAMLGVYRWRTRDSDSGKWDETRERLRTLGGRLKDAIKAGNEDEALAACLAILEWGGERNARRGARPYLTELRAQEALVKYLEAARCKFGLDGAVIDDKQPQAARLNAMLTKIHALASDDGLPIYDSRVAAAIGALVELWRRDEGLAQTPLPQELAFESIASNRSVQHLFFDAQSPGFLSYAAPAEVTAARWSSAKIRLGWVIAEVLRKAPTLYEAEARQDRMHAFEASLFMIGYDVACLRSNRNEVPPNGAQRASLERAATARGHGELSNLPRKTIPTLGKHPGTIEYAGELDTGISGLWGKTPFVFDGDFLQEMLGHFPAGCEAGLGASMTGIIKSDTIGHWIEQHYPAKPRRYASALGAILVDQGVAQCVASEKGIRLRFL